FWMFSTERLYWIELRLSGILYAAVPVAVDELGGVSSAPSRFAKRRSALLPPPHEIDSAARAQAISRVTATLARERMGDSPPACLFARTAPGVNGPSAPRPDNAIVRSIFRPEP